MDGIGQVQHVTHTFMNIIRVNGYGLIELTVHRIIECFIDLELLVSGLA